MRFTRTNIDAHDTFMCKMQRQAARFKRWVFKLNKQARPSASALTSGCIILLSYQRQFTSVRHMEENKSEGECLPTQCLRTMLGISWRDHITNKEGKRRSDQTDMQDRITGHVIRVQSTRPMSTNLVWRPDGVL